MKGYRVRLINIKPDIGPQHSMNVVLFLFILMLENELT